MISKLANHNNILLNLLAMVISLATIIASYLIAEQIYEQMPHLEDEIAYSWQAEIYAKGQLTISSPECTSSFMIPFVIDYHGNRFAKYPPGWPTLLAIGVKLGIRTWINPILAGLAVWLTWRLGQKLFDNATGLLATLLMAISPFFLLISGSLLSHSWSLVLSLSFAITWFDTFNINSLKNKTQKLPKWITIIIAGLCLGLLVLTRPLTAIGVFLGFLIHGLFLFWHGSNTERIQLISISIIAFIVGGMLLVWQYAITGNLFLNPYTLWWNYDKVGFGQGYGRLPGGHNLLYSIMNLIGIIHNYWRDLLGWHQIFWLYLLTGIWAIRKNHARWLIASIPLGLILVYLAYWVSLPRYFFEGTPETTLITALGILRLLDWPNRYKDVLHVTRTFLVLIITLCLIGYNFRIYIPYRLSNMYNLYDINRSRLEPFQNEQIKALTPALILVHTRFSWTDYGTFLDIENPWLTSPFIFALSKGQVIDEDLTTCFPDRSIIYYYPDQPTNFFIYHLPKK